MQPAVTMSTAADAAAMDGHDDRNAQVSSRVKVACMSVSRSKWRRGPRALVVHGDVAAKGFERHARAEMLACAADDERPCRTCLMQVSQHRVHFTPEGGCMVFMVWVCSETRWATWSVMLRKAGEGVDRCSWPDTSWCGVSK